VLSRPSNAQPHADTARAYVGTLEHGKNRGPEVERFLASVGLAPGNPWCAAFVSYCLAVAEPSPVWPETRSGLATRFISRYSIKASHVLLGIRTPEPGDLVVFKRGTTIFGHIGIVRSWSGRCGVTIEGNTSAGVRGSQREGDGVYVRDRCIRPGDYFRIVSFPRVRYE